MPACPTCHEDNPERARFCLACGTPLTGEPSKQEVRKTVTVLFCDVTGSTTLGESHDPESMRRVMARYFEVARQVLERHGGTVEKFIGDAVMTVFGVPRVHEDDALRAVRAAAELRTALARLNEELEREWDVRLQTRTGLNTGEVVAGDASGGQAYVTGDAVNVAARLEAAAPPGEVLLGRDTWLLVRDAVEVEAIEPLVLKGKSEPIQAYRLLAVGAHAEGHARALDSPMVGRTGELALVKQALDRVARENACHLFTILGPAGVGKSRLVEEIVSSAGDGVAVLRGRCLPYGEGISLWPVREVIEGAAGLSESDSPGEMLRKIEGLLVGGIDDRAIAAGIAAAIGLEGATVPEEEVFWAIRKLLESIAHALPLLVVFEDIHWADPTFLDLIDHIADWSRDAAILLLCTARPELLDWRPGWGGGKLNAASILLEPLGPAECSVLIANLLGQMDAPAAIGDRIIESAEGNPLFVEEMLRMLVDDGLVRRAGDSWEASGDLSRVPVPPTIHALLSARLDRLEGSERRVIDRAAVGGKVFYRSAVAALSLEPERPAVGKQLMALVRRELVRPDRSAFAGDDAFRFRHILIRDAAYGGMPKEVRGELHKRFAEWLELAAGERVTEYEEILGYHLEQAYRYRLELGRPDERTAALAGKWLRKAGTRAAQRDDFRGATNLFSRAASLLPDGQMKLETRLDLALSSGAGGDVAACRAMLAEVQADAQVAGLARLERRSRIAQLEMGAWDLAMPGIEIRREIEQMIPLLERCEEHSNLAWAWLVLAQLELTRSSFAAMEEPLLRAREHARISGEWAWGAESRCVRFLSSALFFGPAPAREGILRIEQLRTESGLARSGDAILVGCIGCLRAASGAIAQGREEAARALAAAEDLGVGEVIASIEGFFAGALELLAGELDAAQRLLRRSYNRYEQLGETGRRSSIAGYLAETLYRQGRYAEVREFCTVCRELAAEDDLLSQTQWQSIDAKLLARDGQFEAAKCLAREAVEMVRRGDHLDHRGQSLLDLAEVLQLAGQSDQSLDAAREALANFEAKGNVVQAARTRELYPQM